MKLDEWNPGKRKKILQQRLQDSRKSRKRLEERWESAEQVLLPLLGSDETSGLTVSPDVVGDVSDEFPEVGTNFIAKNLRFLQSQMSANPPACSPKPTSYDPADADAADAADRISRWALRFYDLHDDIDLRNLQTLTYGTGFTKQVWDTDEGEFLKVDEETGVATMTGDFKLTVPNIWDMFLDADARKWKEVRFVFERIRVPWTEALHRWPGMEEQLEIHRKKGGESPATKGDMGGGKSVMSPESYDVVELWEYYEKGLPSNGFQGRYTVITEDGFEIVEMKSNPEKYIPTAVTKQEHDDRIKNDRVPEGRAILPYDVLTDLDDLERPWGRSVLEFAGPLQDQLNRLDSCLLQTADANGVPRVLLPESAEIADSSLTSVAYDVVKYTGNIPPDIMDAAPLSQVVAHLRAQFKADIDEIMGVNESMFGQASREQSGYHASYSVNQGNMIRQRLFNKFVSNTERLYKRILLMAANKWKTPRLIDVMGEENVHDVKSFRGSDIAFGYGVVAEFSSSLSLDPMARRSEIMTMWPMLKEAGLDQKKLVQMLKLSELGNTFDITKVPGNRMKAYFDEITKTGMQKEPRPKENHPEMLVFAQEFVMLQAFHSLPEPIKVLIEEHITLREELVAAAAQPPEGAAPGAAGPGAAPGAAP